MYNLLITLGIASAFFALGMVVAGTLVAGFVPGLIALVISYFLLARRTGKAFQLVAERAAAELGLAYEFRFAGYGRLAPWVSQAVTEAV